MTERKPYPSDLSDARWALIEPKLTAWRKARLDRRPTGQPAKVELRDVFNAILLGDPFGLASGGVGIGSHSGAVWEPPMG